ncbi:MAG: tetratricopeptide repeat protein [Ignavibacteriaceae bacterium]|nr:tetratricopeptide repeat protein [Ignavibacteriaceae bacterium]
MKTDNVAFENKVKLICESEIQSPLFARWAWAEIENNNIDNALNILESGLKTYPDYPVAHFIYGKCLVLKGRVEEAKAAVLKGAELIHSEESFVYYNDMIATLSGETESEGGLSIESLAEQLANAKMPKFMPPQENYTEEEVPDFDVSFFTETYAKILLEQGKVAEAITVFEKLIQLHPEKREYYLSRVEEIKKED